MSLSAMTNNTPKNSTGFDEKLQLLKQWRDFHWQAALYYRYLGIPDNMEDSVAVADAYNTAMQIITGEDTVAPTITHDQFAHIPYTEGEWPE